MVDAPACKSVRGWLQQHKGKRCFAPFTQQDGAAWCTFVHALCLYGYSDDTGRAGALAAMRGAAQAMQPHTRHLARDVIPAILNWSDLVALWPKVDTAVQIIDHDTPETHAQELRTWAQSRAGGAVP